MQHYQYFSAKWWLSPLKMVLSLHPQSPLQRARVNPHWKEQRHRDIWGITHIRAVPKALQGQRLHCLQACVTLQHCLCLLFALPETCRADIVIPLGISGCYWQFLPFFIHSCMVFGQFCTVFQLMSYQCLSTKWWALAVVLSALFSHNQGISDRFMAWKYWRQHSVLTIFIFHKLLLCLSCTVQGLRLK